jgi:hypothetical protein
VKYQSKLPVYEIFFLDCDDEMGPLEAGSDDEFGAQELDNEDGVEYIADGR